MAKKFDTSAVERAYNLLLARIQADDVHVNTKLASEPDLSRDLQVGRGTLREASRILQASGYIEVRPGKGTFVISKEGINRNKLADWFVENEPKIKEFLQVRMALEPMTVRLAIERCSNKDIKNLRVIHNCAVQAAAEKNSAALAICDENFHTFITKCSQNKLLVEIIKNINDLMKDFRGKTFLLPGNVDNLIPAHEKILEAFEQRNPEAGADSMYQHLTKVVQDYENSKEVL